MNSLYYILYGKYDILYLRLLRGGGYRSNLRLIHLPISGRKPGDDIWYFARYNTQYLRLLRGGGYNIIYKIWYFTR